MIGVPVGILNEVKNLGIQQLRPFTTFRVILCQFVREGCMVFSSRQKTAIVTGATGSIGKAIAIKLAKLGFRVVVISRDRNKTLKVVEEIILISGNPKVSYELVDLSRGAEIETLANSWNGPLEVLVNNAAVTSRTRQETPEGVELQFATNVLGYFRMTQAFQKILRTSAPARVVDVASYWAGDLDSSDLEFKRRRYNNGTAYRQSKQANRMLIVAWASRLKQDGITINACHPGDVNSNLSYNLGFGGSQSPDQGAETPTWLASESIGGQISGKYFEYKRETRCRFGENKEAVEALFEACKQYD
jgi:NAD(P)-dependent dehydrogenase (short-subunit alcohol dehydrogenase family)